MRAWALWAILMLLLPHFAWSETLPAKGVVDSRIRTATYSPDEVFKLHAYVGYHIDLEFESDESFVALSGGDLEALTFKGHGNVLTLKPKAAAAEMNLAVTTTKRRYYLEYTASAARPDRFLDPVMYAVRFVYPGSSSANRVERSLGSAANERHRNFDYWFCGHSSLKPVSASDDGVHTRLTFGNRAELPAIFTRNEDGSESLLNFSVNEGDVVLHRIARRFIVRRGSLAGCIVNKAFVGGGERLDSGTVSPEVKRVRKDARP